MLYIAADSSVGGMVDVRAVNKHLVERFRGSRQKFKLTSEGLGTLPRRPAQGRPLSVGVVG
jgi:hypothetical protein